MIASIARLGGRAALAVLIACGTLTYADTLGYFYSYTNSNFGAAITNDALAGQNLSVAPTVSLISLQTATPTASFGSSTTASVFTQSVTADIVNPQTAGYSAMVQSYGYSMPSTQVTTTTTSATSGVTNYAAPTMIPTASTVSPTSGGTLDLTSIIVPSSSGTTTSSSSTTGSALATSGTTTTTTTNGNIQTTSTLTASPYAGISFVTVRYDTVVTATPTSSSSVSGPIVGNTNISTLLPTTGNPEPATFGIAAAALGLVALKLRRK